MNLHFDYATLHDALLKLIIMVVSLSLHEWGHAAMADRLGDDTPRLQGRVTFYPPAHIDPIGTLLLPFLAALGFFGGFATFGWAKPVMINPSNFAHRNRDCAWVTIAGPAMNLLVALVATFASVLAARWLPSAVPYLYLLLKINVVLIVFNLLPIPPLDGSKFLMYWFGMGEEAYMNLSRFSWIILLVLLNMPAFRTFFVFLLDHAMTPFWMLLNWLS